MTIQASDLIIQTFTNKDDITRYIDGQVAQQMARAVWRPRGVVLHNTGSPTLAQFNRGPHGTQIDDRQRILNSIPDWQKRGFSGCPHGFVLPGRFTTANPIWKQGTHSPSWNKTFWGIEMAGDFDAEVFPPETLDYATHVLACLYALIGHEPDDSTFHLHKEDPLTEHKHCPGAHAGDKATWIKRIRERMTFLDPGDAAHGVPPPAAAERVGKVSVAANDVLFLRTAAGASNKAIASLPPGERLVIVGDAGNGWLNVKASDGKTGWVAGRYVAIS